MTRAEIAPFYGPAHRGDEFNKRRIVNGQVNYHRGYDINNHPVGKPIPSIIGGYVVGSSWSSALGWFVVVNGDGVWAGEVVGYSHLRVQGRPLGTAINLGDHVGELGNTGSATTGPHVHITRHSSGFHPGTASVINPWPLIEAALSAPSGGGVTPINPVPQEDDMTPNESAQLTETRTNVIELRQDLANAVEAISQLQTAVRTVTALLTNGGQYLDKRGNVVTMNYGVLPIIAATQGTVDQIKAATVPPSA